MGRPRDEFSWAQVEVTEDGWICKFCKEDFKGSASRIRNHLSGQGTDISACPAVPEEIQKEALKKVTRKRGRTLQSSSSSTPTSVLHDPSPSSLNDPDSFNKRCKEEYVAHAFIKFLMCNNSSSTISDVLKYPYIREFLERADVGVPSSLIQGDPKFVIERSLLTIKQEVCQHMLMVKESWKTTGCTMMMFNLNRENKGKSFLFEKDTYVCGFYCPKGFIFVEVPNPNIDRKGFLGALERHSPSLSLDNADHGIHHHESKSDEGLEDLENDYSYEFSDNGEKSIAPLLTPFQYRCARQEIQRTCIMVCSGFEWAQGLINKAIKIQKLIQSDEHLGCWCDRLLTEKGKRLKHKGNLNAKGASGLSNFLSIMLLENDLKKKLSYEVRFRSIVCSQGVVETILDDFNFWGDGKKLERVLNLILKILDLMDTLVPTAGYLAMAIDTVDQNFKYYRGMGEECLLWRAFVTQLRISSSNVIEWEVYGCMNPLYYLRDPEQQHKAVAKVLKSEFYDQEDAKKLEGELNCYHNVCRNLLTEINFHNYHPVKLWEKYGGELPVLQKRAIKLFSQPVTCMCNQVKKHMYELQGVDDFILRLNLRMMEEFKLLGDDIYKPLALSELEDWGLTSF